MRRGIAGKMLLTALMLCLLLSGLTVSGAENLFDPENAFDGLYMTEIADRPGVFTNSSADEGISTGKETFYLPGLTPNYTFSGHIKIVDIGSEAWTRSAPDYRQRHGRTLLSCDYKGMGRPF